MKNSDRSIPSKPKKNHLIIVLKIILAALPTIVFGVFTIIFTVQQNQTANENRKLDERQANEHSIRTTFENYIDDISKLLLNEKFNRSNSEHLLHIRVKTLTVLRNVDATRKRDIILFLYESRLLRSDAKPNERLYLKDADLTGLEFIGTSSIPIQLDHLYLPSVQLSNGIFHWCILDYAVFDNSSMMNVILINSSISYASFRQIYAPAMTVGDLIFHQNNFSGAVLTRIYFQGGADWKDGVDMSNADLFQSRDYLGRPLDLQSMLYNSPILINTRAPNGAFYYIDSSNLFHHDRTQSQAQCQSTINQQNYENCVFLAESLNRSSRTGLIHVHSFSVLVDSGHAGYNLSAYMGCGNDQQMNRISINIDFLKNNFLWIDTHFVLVNQTKLQKYPSKQGHIPENTRIIQMNLYADINIPSSFCIINELKFNIFYKKK